jgi:hypothetical protein
MKTIKIYTLMLVMAFFSIAAGAQKPKPKNNIDAIVKAYMGIKDALAANDGTTAHYKASDLFNILKASPDLGLKRPEQQHILVNYLDQLLDDSREISQTVKESEQREHFASLSKNMYDLLKGLKLNTTTIYEQYCPMKKAYWLSESKTIKNPYYSDEMSTCGKVTATLPSAK